MVFVLRARMVPVIVLAFVRQVSAKVKKLQGAEQRRQNPKQNEVLLRNPNLQNIKQNRHKNNLPDSKVIAEETKKPTQKVAVVVIRVVLGMHVAVVQMVFGVQFGVPKSGVKQGANLSDYSVYNWIWGNRAVHCIMRCNEKAGV